MKNENFFPWLRLLKILFDFSKFFSRLFKIPPDSDSQLLIFFYPDSSNFSPDPTPQKYFRLPPPLKSAGLPTEDSTALLLLNVDTETKTYMQAIHFDKSCIWTLSLNLIRTKINSARLLSIKSNCLVSVLTDLDIVFGPWRSKFICSVNDPAKSRPR